MKMDIAGYSIEDKSIYDSPHTVILKGRRDSDELSVIVKTLHDEQPSPAEILQFKTECEITGLFDTDLIARVYSVEKYRNSYALILEHVDFSSIGGWLANAKKFEIKVFLEVAIQIAEAIGEIHQKQVIHNDINPSNILYDQEQKKIKVIDFGLAASLPKAWAPVVNPNMLQGTLPYLSPEQTGRMNRGIDYRTDFYSLGATFYQMLTGQPPFQSQDPMELIHSHIAIIPKNPSAIDPAIPEFVSGIVLKLMSKEAEDRYQSSSGLIYDLNICLDQLNLRGEIESLQLGSKDVFNRFQIPDKLYGRSKEVNRLLDAYNRMMNGKVELMLVAGYSGIGKSSLVHEVHKPIVEKRGFFIAGKFEQFKHNIPYAAFTQSYTELINQLLTESAENIETYKSKILDAVGDKGQLLIDVIPNLSLIIGEQPPVIELAPTESQNRFCVVFQSFIKSLASSERPLTIFLDDLQWADTPSLQMIETLLTNLDCRYLLIIGAYRDNEVDITHPLTAMLEDLSKRGVFCETIELGPLQKTNVNELIADTLHQTKESVSSLADLCYERTGGNPFFLVQTLQSLYQDQLIAFDNQSNEWKWDLEKIQKKKISDNVVDLVLGKLKLLDEATQHLIQLAACIGSRFSIDILCEISKQGFEEVITHLKKALKEGFIVKRGEVVNPPTYQFSHDRIQQAADEMLDDAEKRTIHIDICKLLLKETSEDKMGEEIFDIVNHFNMGISSGIPDYIDSVERIRMAKLNLKAAKMAKSAAAYEPALKYAESGIECLDESTWNSDYDLMYELYVEATDAASLASKFELMEKYSEITTKHAKNIYDELKICMIKMFYYNAQEKFQPAIDLAIHYLRRLGINVPTHPNLFHVLVSIVRVKLRLIGKKIPDFINLPVLQDPDKMKIMHLINYTVSVAYTYTPNLFPILSCESITRSLRDGNARESAGSYSAYGVVICGALNEIEKGYQFGDLALNLVEKMNIEQDRVRITVGLYGFLKHWKDPIKGVATKLLENFTIGVNKGDIEYACYALSLSYYYRFLSGSSIRELLPKLEAHVRVIKNLENLNVFERMSILNQFVFNLANPGEQPTMLVGKAYDEVKALPTYVSESDKQCLLLVYSLKLMLNCYFEDHTNSQENINLSDKYIDALISTFIVPNYVFFKAIALLSMYPQSRHKWKSGWAIRMALSKLKGWSKHAPMNQTHRYYLVEAEWRHKILGQYEKAEEFYNKAIKTAAENEFLNDEAMANELFAQFYLSHDREQFAKIYLEAARYCYLIWGADAKVAQLEEKYPKLLGSKPQSSQLSSLTTISTSYTGKASSAMLDMGTLQKCSQLISSTIVLDDLLNKLMHIVIENAGAQKSFLLLSKNEKYVIEAEGNVDHKNADVLKSIEPTSENIPTSIINYVIRTKESVVLENAVRSDKFSADPYIAAKNSKSILCIPLLNQGSLTGVLYLENDLLERAFTKDRIDLLNLLSSQIAISIDNARLYEGTVELNRSYERFVPQDFLNLLEKKSIIDVELGDHTEKNMSVLFTDIRNFTSRSEQMAPEENFIFINGFLNVIAPIIRKHNGFIDKYIGDAIMALFPTGADEAVRCAIDMQQSLHKYNLKMSEQEPISIGIGINTGFLMLGTVGEERRLGATVISDAVNIASRVESMTKVENAKILITEETYKNLTDPSDYTIQLVGGAMVKGKSKEITIYRIEVPEPTE